MLKEYADKSHQTSLEDLRRVNRVTDANREANIKIRNIEQQNQELDEENTALKNALERAGNTAERAWTKVEAAKYKSIDTAFMLSELRSAVRDGASTTTVLFMLDAIEGAAVSADNNIGRAKKKMENLLGY
eukprot:g15377.t1